MKRAITACICVWWLGGSAFAQNYQIPNSDFEVWNDVNEPGDGWYSFVSASASGLAAIGKPLAKGNTTKIDGRTGAGIQLVSASVVGKKANGNLTSGRINMGSTTPTNASNYNFTDRDADTNNCLFIGLPDSVSCWAKFSRGEDKEYSAQGNFILHGDIDYKDPHESEANVSAYRIAGGTLEITPCVEWTYFSIPMTHTEIQSEKMYMLGSFTTNPTPGASAGDVLQIDDVRFIYNSKLESLTIGGISLEGFDKDTYAYEFDSYAPAIDDVMAVADGKGATVDVQLDAGVMEVTVEGNDIEDNTANFHTYTLVFKWDVGFERNVASTVRLKSINRGVAIEGARPGDCIEIYSVQGVKVGQYTADGSTLMVDNLFSNTVYLVRIGSYVTRVLTK